MLGLGKRGGRRWRSYICVNGIYEPLLSSIFLLPIPNLRVFRLQERRPDGLFEVTARSNGLRKILEELEVNVYGHWSGLLSEDGQDSLGRS